MQGKIVMAPDFYTDLAKPRPTPAACRYYAAVLWGESESRFKDVRALEDSKLFPPPFDMGSVMWPATFS